MHAAAPGLVGRGPSSRPFSVFSGLDGRRPRLLVVVPPPACSAPSPRTSGGSIAMHVFLVYVRTDDLQVPCDLVQKKSTLLYLDKNRSVVQQVDLQSIRSYGQIPNRANQSLLLYLILKR
jgi:hypothetical protein